jgi:hypothetical protein
MQAVLAPPVPVESVGAVAAAGALGKTPKGVLAVADIKRLAASL